MKNRVNIRSFSRFMYNHTLNLPVEVYNKKTGEVLFVVISPEKGGDKDDVETKDIIQPK